MNEAYLRFLGVSNADVRGYDWAHSFILMTVRRMWSRIWKRL